MKKKPNNDKNINQNWSTAYMHRLVTNTVGPKAFDMLMMKDFDDFVRRIYVKIPPEFELVWSREGMTLYRGKLLMLTQVCKYFYPGHLRMACRILGKGPNNKYVKRLVPIMERRREKIIKRR